MNILREQAQRRYSPALGLLLASSALVGCQIDNSEPLANTTPTPQITHDNFTSPEPEPTKTEPELIKVALPRDKRCYQVGKVACIELEKTPGIKGTLFAMRDGEVQFKVPVRSGSTNHTDGNIGIYTPRCETTIQSKSDVVYSTLLEQTVGPIPMYNAMSIACTDEIHDRGYHGGVYIHGSLSFDSYGYGVTGADSNPVGSHGCVNVNYANGNSLRIYNYLGVGDTAVLYDKSTMHIGYKFKEIN